MRSSKPLTYLQDVSALKFWDELFYSAYSFDTAVLALSLWYRHVPPEPCRLLQVPHTGNTPSHLIFRSLHASQAKATFRRRRAPVSRVTPRSNMVPEPWLTIFDLGMKETC